MATVDFDIMPTLINPTEDERNRAAQILFDLRGYGKKPDPSTYLQDCRAEIEARILSMQPDDVDQALLAVLSPTFTADAKPAEESRIITLSKVPK